jgi:hypothetical protein
MGEVSCTGWAKEAKWSLIPEKNMKVQSVIVSKSPAGETGA